MYKERVNIKTYNNELRTVNIETIGERVDYYRYYFCCDNCKNQSIAADEYNIHTCVNCRIFIDISNEKVYCENYAKDGE